MSDNLIADPRYTCKGAGWVRVNGTDRETCSGCVDCRLCEGCGHELPKDHTVREGLHLCDKCAKYDDQESEVRQ